MQIERSDSSTSSPPPEPTFSGDVTISGYFRRKAPSQLAGATVGFGPGARTPWKTNPMGQTVVVLGGIGWVQSDGGPVVEVQAGDVVWWSPGERHWEGATPDAAMTCFVFQEEASGSVAFGDQVTDDEYRVGSANVTMAPGLPPGS